MQEIVTFLKSLLSRKFLFAAGVFYAKHRASIPPKWQSLTDVILAGLYFIANIADKKVAPPVTTVNVNNAPPLDVTPPLDGGQPNPEQPLEDQPPGV